MLLFTLKTLGICISLLAWFMLSLACFSLVWQAWKNNMERIKLLLPILIVIWTLVTYHTWYEGFFLLSERPLFPSLNSWAITLILPLLYLYYRYLIIGKFPDWLQWWLNLSPSGLLLCIYMVMASLSHYPDKTIEGWPEFLSSFSSWGVLFRLICCAMSMIQLVVYLPSLQKADMEFNPTPFFQRKNMLTLCLIAVIALHLLCSISSYSLYSNLLITIWSGIVFFRSSCYEVIKRKLRFYILPAQKTQVEYKDEGQNESISTDEFSKFSPETIYKIHQIVDSREFLFEPESTIVVLADKMSVNVTYLSLYFNKKLKMNFPEYMKVHRLKIAEEFLEDTDMQIADVGIKIGFKNISTFSQAFHERYGMTPMQWRNEKKKTLNKD